MSLTEPSATRKKHLTPGMFSATVIDEVPSPLRGESSPPSSLFSPLLTFRPRVSLFAHDQDYHVRSLHQDEAKRLIDSGHATVATQDRHLHVTALRLTQNPGALDAKPGSFGVRVEVLETGHCFAHRKTWEKQLLAYETATRRAA